MKQEEKEINIAEVIFDCLLHWRGAIIAMIIGAILLGAFGYVKNYKDSKAAYERAIAAQNGPTGTLASAGNLNQVQIATINTAIDQQIYLEKLQDYRNFFDYSKFDYTAVPTCEYVFSVSADTYEDAYNVANKYALYINSNEMKEYLKKNGKLDTEYVNELVSCNVQSNPTVMTVNNAEASKDKEKVNQKAVVFFKITVIHQNEELCKALMTELEKFVESKRDIISKEFSMYDIRRVDNSFTYATNYDLLTKIKKINDDYDNVLNQLGKNLDSLPAEAMEYYNLGIEEHKLNEKENKFLNDDTATIDIDEKPATIAPPKGHISKKFILIGAVAFICVYWGILILFKYVLSSKIKRGDSLEDLYEVPFIGSIVEEPESKKFLGFIDNFIVKIRDRNKRKFAANENLDIIASSIKIAAQKKEISDIISIGCDLKVSADTTAKLYEELKNQGINVTELDNILYKSENMSKVPESKGAIIIERIDGTLYDEIAKEIDILKSQEIPVLGILTIE